MTEQPVDPLDNTRVDVVIRLVDGVDAADLALLDVRERARARAFVAEADAGRYVAGRAQLRRMLGLRMGLPPEAVPLTSAGGRPVVAGPTAGRAGAAGPPSGSVAHAGRFVVVAAAPGGRLGVDVEPLEPRLPRTEQRAIARSVLGLTDHALARLEDPDDDAAWLAFLAQWTLAEAVLKALGTGLAADVTSLSVDADAEPPMLLAAPGIGADQAASWTLRRIRVGLADRVGGALVAVASDLPGASVVFRGHDTMAPGAATRRQPVPAG